MNSDNQERPDLFKTVLAWVMGVVIAACGLFVILDRAAPIVVKPSAPSAVAKPAVRPPAPTPPIGVAPAPARSPASTVYRCTFNGTTTYSDSPCPGATVVDVSPASQGFVPTRPMRMEAVRDEVATAAVGPTSAGHDKVRRDARCAWIEKEIERIDALARQGQAASTQDWLRQERQKLVDERYVLKC
jgi:hypothetical protein